jgi:uncharacterized heparinase superfamily protein
MLDLLRAAGEGVPEEARARVTAMVTAFGVLSRPGGSLHLFNDAAEGIAPARGWLDAMARRVCGAAIPAPEGCFALPRGGYWGFAGAAERMVVDCGEAGPAYQPGHAHCDLLSFELDLADRPVVVDAGVAGYEAGPLRTYARATRAHNTVTIGGGDQSEVWGAFRVARRATVRSATAEVEPGGFHFRGAYSPYHDPRVVHHREIRRDADGWTITDRVEGAPGAELVTSLHLHPDFIARLDRGEIRACAGNVCVVVEPFGVDRVEIHRGEHSPERGWHFPEFGVILPAPEVEMVVARNHGREFGYRLRLAAPVRDGSTFTDL